MVISGKNSFPVRFSLNCGLARGLFAPLRPTAPVRNNPGMSFGIKGKAVVGTLPITELGSHRSSHPCRPTRGSAPLSPGAGVSPVCRVGMASSAVLAERPPRLHSGNDQRTALTRSRFPAAGATKGVQTPDKIVTCGARLEHPRLPMKPQLNGRAAPGFQQDC